MLILRQTLLVLILCIASLNAQNGMFTFGYSGYDFINNKYNDWSTRYGTHELGVRYGPVIGYIHTLNFDNKNIFLGLNYSVYNSSSLRKVETETNVVDEHGFNQKIEATFKFIDFNFGIGRKINFVKMEILGAALFTYSVIPIGYYNTRIYENPGGWIHYHDTDERTFKGSGSKIELFVSSNFNIMSLKIIPYVKMSFGDRVQIIDPFKETWHEFYQYPENRWEFGLGIPISYTRN